jgi:hypothetical protein
MFLLNSSHPLFIRNLSWQNTFFTVSFLFINSSVTVHCSEPYLHNSFQAGEQVCWRPGRQLFFHPPASNEFESKLLSHYLNQVCCIIFIKFGTLCKIKPHTNNLKKKSFFDAVYLKGKADRHNSLKQKIATRDNGITAGVTTNQGTICQWINKGYLAQVAEV